MTLKSMSTQLTIRANATPDKGVRQRTQRDPAGIIFQFYTLTPDEQAERKAKLERRAARKKANAQNDGNGEP